MVKKLNQFYIFLFLFCYRVLRGKEVRRNGDEAVFRLCEDFQIASAVHRVCRESRTRKLIPSLNALPLPSLPASRLQSLVIYDRAQQEHQ